MLALAGCAGASAGGQQRDSPDSGIDWRTIFALPSNDVCSIHVYSPHDERTALPAVASYCRQMGKPWITEEFGWEQSIGDRQRADNFARIYDLQGKHHSAGVGFWNLGAETAASTFSVNESTPMTLRIVRQFTQGSGALAQRPTSDGFVKTCGRQLCIDGQPWRLHAGSAYGGLKDPISTVRLAQDSCLNTVRIVNFLAGEEEGRDPATAPFDEASWRQVDRLIAAAAEANLRVILDLSTYRNLLLNAGVNPYTTDWGPVVDFATSRRNTMTGVRYRDDPTIALISLAGEVEPPANHKDLGVEPAHITAFFARTLGQWKTADPRHLVNTGGLIHLNAS